MQNIKLQGKDHKVAATQESTAQNSVNQSKAFGLFTDDELANIVHNSGAFLSSKFFINSMHQAERMIDKARMNQDNKNFIKETLRMLVSFGKWDIVEHYEFIIQNSDPDDIREMLEDGDKEGAVEELDYEIGIITGDLQREDLFFPEEEVEKAKEALNEYYSIINEYGLQDLFDDYIFKEMDKVLGIY